MADFISALTGVQMDQALLDMAEHNSEAYAVGERNGIAVASDDVTYHNNARYYAQIASSQIVGDASSAVRWDTDQSEVLTDAQKAQARENINAASDSDVVKITAQTLTSAQQAQARANIAAGGTNPNLLDNWYFVGGGSQLGDGVFPINQRGQTSYSGGGVQLDRWHGWAGTDTLVLTANGLEYTSPSSNGLLQYFPVFPTTETVTFSAKIGGTIYSVTLPEGQNQVRLDWPTFGLTVDRNDKAVGIFSYNSTLLLQAAKLEVGTVSTLANDAPPDYWQELAKCQYYCRVIETSGYFAFGIAAGSAHIQTPLQYAMRARPSVSFTGSIALFGANDLTVSSIVVSAWGPSAVCLDFVTTGATSRTPYIVNMSNAKIVLSADL